MGNFDELARLFGGNSRMAVIGANTLCAYAASCAQCLGCRRFARVPVQYLWFVQLERIGRCVTTVW